MDLTVFLVSELCNYLFLNLNYLRNGSARLGPARPPGGPVPAGGPAGTVTFLILEGLETPVLVVSSGVLSLARI